MTDTTSVFSTPVASARDIVTFLNDKVADRLTTDQLDAIAKSDYPQILNPFRYEFDGDHESVSFLGFSVWSNHDGDTRPPLRNANDDILETDKGDYVYEDLDSYLAREAETLLQYISLCVGVPAIRKVPLDDSV